MSDMKHDVDALETQEWLAALESVVREEGVERAQYLLEQVLEKARLDGVDMPTGVTTNYINTIPAAQEPAYQVTPRSNVVSVQSFAGTRS